MAWALWGYHPDAPPSCWPRRGRCCSCCRSSCSGAAARGQTMILAARGLHAVDRPDRRLGLRPLAVRGALLPRRRPAAAPAHRAARHRLDPPAAPRDWRSRASSMLTLVLGLADQQTNTATRGCTTSAARSSEIKADAGPRSLLLYEPPRHALRAGVLRARHPQPAAEHGAAAAKRREPGVRPRLVPGQQAASSTRRTRSSGSSTSTGASLRTLQDRANGGLGVPMSSRPWDVRLRQVTWQPVPTSVDVRTRVRAHADLRDAGRRLVLRLAAEPGPRSARRTSTAC